MTTLDRALDHLRTNYATPESRDHALAVVEVETWDPWPDLTRALKRLAEPMEAARRREARERWHPRFEE